MCLKSSFKLDLRNRNQFFLNFFQYLFAFSLIINMRSVYVHTPRLGFVNNLVVLTSGIAMVGCVLVRRRFALKRFSNGLALAVLVFFLFGFLYLVDPLKKDMLLKYTIEAPVIALYCAFAENNIAESINKIVNLSVIIAAYSLCFWIAGSMLHLFSPTDVWVLNWGSASGDELGRIQVYYGVYFECQTILLPGGLGRIIRNTAIFTEAPMCSFIFTFALLGEMFIAKKQNIVKCAILAAAIISTFSTTGISVMLCSIGLKLIFEIGFRSKIEPWKFFLVYIVCPLMLLIFLFIGIQLVSMKMDTGSGSSRMSDFVNGLHAWIDKPILGYGIGSDALNREYGSYGYSNSVIPILTQGGLYLFLPYLISALYGVGNLLIFQRWKRLCFYTLYLIMFVVTISPFQIMTFYMFLAMLLEQNYRDNQRENFLDRINTVFLRG